MLADTDTRDNKLVNWKHLRIACLGSNTQHLKDFFPPTLSCALPPLPQCPPPQCSQCWWGSAPQWCSASCPAWWWTAWWWDWPVSPEQLYSMLTWTVATQGQDKQAEPNKKTGHMKTLTGTSSQPRSQVLGTTKKSGGSPTQSMVNQRKCVTIKSSHTHLMAKNNQGKHQPWYH